MLRKLAYAAVLVGALAAPLFLYPVLLMKILCFALFACAFNLLIGFTGLLSFGHAAFFGGASYIAGHALKVWGFPTELGLLLGVIFAALMGLSFATIFVIFSMGSIFTAFMGAAVLFGTMSGYGYFTKQSLDSVGKYAFVALIAICIASIVNIFIGSTVMQMVISAIAILVFLALTAYDTQQIREMVSNADATAADEVSGALSLYLDFINLFINLLQIIGIRKDD